jgi:hypothetical protein
MKIIFSCLGFRSAEVFLIEISEEFPGQYNIGEIFDRYDHYEFDYYGLYLERFKEILPTPEAIISEYIKQYENKGVCLNPNIVLAG